MRVRWILSVGTALTSCAVYDPALLDSAVARDSASADGSVDGAAQSDASIDGATMDAAADARDSAVADTSADSADACRCSSMESCCSGACVTLASSTEHCGRCGNRCPNTTCVSGSCTNTCVLGFDNCDGNATNGCESDLGASELHCGRCGNACSFAHAAATCERGTCRMGACDPGFADCDMNAANGCEVNIDTSLTHCGACDARCSMPGMVAVCNMGRCESSGCVAGRDECDGDMGTVCETDTTSSLAHCGRCGNACAIPNSRNTCTMGMCASLGCNPGFGSCDMNAANGCEVDTRTSLAHCGACNTPCARPNATTSCVSGTCSLGACNPGFGNCDANATNGCEAALTSATHCGRCGNSCGASTCNMGVCDNVRVVQLTAGDAHTCARRNNGTIACWGSGADGRLGDGAALMRTAPVAVTTIADATKVIAGGNFTCANRASNVFCWGNNANGQLGTGNTTSSLVPVRAGSLISGLDIAAGAAHTCTVTGATGSIHVVGCWGDNAQGQVGNASATVTITMPVATSPSFTDWSQAVAGGAHTCGRRGANVYCWGNNSSGQLGIGSTVQQRGPVQVTAITNAVELAAGRNHTCARVTSGAVVCWGANASGQLGDGTTVQRLLPVIVTGLTDAIAITAGDLHTCAVRATGAVVCWGANTSGQLGDGTNTQRLVPTTASGLSAGIADVTAGASHTCVRRSDHQVLCWGANASGQLGDGTTVARNAPTLVQGLY